MFQVKSNGDRVERGNGQMENMQNYLIFLVIAFSSGLAIGAGIVWLYARARVKTEMQLER